MALKLLLLGSVLTAVVGVQAIKPKAAIKTGAVAVVNTPSTWEPDGQSELLTMDSVRLAETVPAAVPVATPTATRLPPLDLADMALWNWGGRWHASEWGNGMGPLPWKYDHITQPGGTDTYFRLDAAGAPELQAMGGTAVYNRGLWEADVTAPTLKEGMVVAPLWLYDSNTGDEVDFEFVGRRGLDVSLHARVDGAVQRNTVRLFAGRDMSGERHRFAIKVDAPAGYVDMYLDGIRVHRWERATLGYMVANPLKPMMSMWAADPNNESFVYWTGRWTGLAPDESATMTVHGYGYSTID